MSFSPPMDFVNAVTAEVAQMARSNLAIEKSVTEFEGRYGALNAALGEMDWHSSDMAYFIRPVEGGHERVLRCVMPGHLVTGLERGFLPLSLAAYEAELATKTDTRVRCEFVLKSGEVCNGLFKNKRALSMHMTFRHGLTAKKRREAQPSQTSG